MLRNPEFGNIFRLHHSPIIHRTMDGLVRFRKPNRPSYESFSVKIIALTRDEANLFIEFALSFTGQEITLKDHENRTWFGIITTDPLVITRGIGECNDSISFDFEGLVV